MSDCEGKLEKLFSKNFKFGADFVNSRFNHRLHDQNISVIGEFDHVTSSGSCDVLKIVSQISASKIIYYAT